MSQRVWYSVSPTSATSGIALGDLAMTLASPVFLTIGIVGNLLSQTAAIAALAIGQLLVRLGLRPEL